MLEGIRDKLYLVMVGLYRLAGLARDFHTAMQQLSQGMQKVILLLHQL